MDREGKRVDIPRSDLAALLMVHLDIVREETIQRHISIMERLGYIKRVQGAGLIGEARYDLVGWKVAMLGSSVARNEPAIETNAEDNDTGGEGSG